MSNLTKNIFYQTFYEILIIILPFLTSPYISRVLGPEGLGIFSYTYSITYYFQLFGMLGIKFYGNRMIARVRENKEKSREVYSEILIIHVVFSILSCLLYLIYTLFFSDYKYYSMIQFLIVFSTVFDVSWLFFGLEKFKITVLRSALIKIISVVFIFLFVKSKEDLGLYIFIMAGAQLINQLFLFFLASKYVDFSSPKFSNCRKHIRPLFVLFIPVLAVSLFKYMDKIMLGIMANKIELGYYENAEKVLNIPLSLVISFGMVMMPRMSNLMMKNENDDVHHYINISLEYMMVISIAMAFGMAGMADIFAPVFWGSGFIKSGYLIKGLAFSLPFSTIASIIRNQDLIPKGKDKIYSYSIIIGALVNLITNYLLIPKYQSIGVCIGTIAAEITVCLAELYFTRDKKEYFISILKGSIYVLPGGIMYFFINKLGNYLGLTILSLIGQLIFGIIIFIGLSLGIMLILKDKYLFMILRKLNIKI